MRFGFVTCVELGLACMKEIYRVGGILDLVITLPDKRSRKKSGRIYVDKFCAEHNIDVEKVSHVDDPASVAAIKDHEIDWLFIIGWSQIAGNEVLESPKYGCLGMHPTLLPQGRGRAAIPWAILKGLNQTGVTLFKLDEGVDTGPILAQEIIQLASDETATSLYKRVAKAHRTLIARIWSDLVSSSVVLKPQDDGLATVWPGRKPADGIILPQEMDCEYVDRLVRAVTHPYPGAFIDHKQNRYIIWRGQVHPGKELPHPVIHDENDHLWISLKDGCLQADDWETVSL